MSQLSKNLKNSSITLTAILVNALLEWFVTKLDKFQTKEISFLAYEGFINNQLYFREFDLRKAKVNFQNLTAFLTNAVKFHLLQGRIVTYFAHLMWQEFFVAVKLRFFSIFSNKEEVKNILSQLESEKFEMVTRFLFGLCHKQTMHDLLDHIEIEELNSETDRQICEEMLKELAIDKLNKYKNSFKNILPILGWVRETGDDYFTEKAAACLRDDFEIDDSVQILPTDI